jgi:prepilin-type N-terminal cleavage/methylation domain-containing protein
MVRKNAFTLVEVLIVVVVLGILAVIVAPRFSSASTDTRASALTRNLRAGVEHYHPQHDSNYPADHTTFAAQMTGHTTASGDLGGGLGPYLPDMPNNPYTGTNDISADDGAVTGWYYGSTASLRARLCRKVSEGTVTLKANDGDPHNEGR